MGLFGRNRISIDDVTVSLNGWQIAERNKGITQYVHENGDAFSVNFFDKKPDIGAPLNDQDGVRDSYRQMLGSAGFGLIECNVVDFAGLPAVHLLLKAKMDPTGMVFFSSYTLPRKRHSFVFKFQAIESGVTGLRESAVFAMHPELQLDESTGKMIGWSADPYDITCKFPLMRNLADDEKYDSKFPDHPLSRSRKFVSELIDHVTISDKFKRLPEFIP